MHGGIEVGPLSDEAKTLGALRYGLYLLTTGSREDPRGMPVSWVSQVGGKPPLLMVAVRRNRPLIEPLREKGSLCLNLLPSGDKKLMSLLARPADKRFQGIGLERGALGLPYVSDGVGALFCSIEEIIQPGDHALFICRVEEVLWKGPGPAMGAEESGHAYLGLS